MEQVQRSSGSEEVKEVRDDLQEQGDAVTIGEECACHFGKEPLGGWTQVLLPG